jgi:SAM-dependent methyltransferase
MPVEILSRSTADAFPEDWYAFATATHFWLEWRLWAFLRQIGQVGIDRNARFRVLEIGCGSGALRRQIEDRTNWSIDGCDLNAVGLEQASSQRGRTLLYDIFDRREELRERYDGVVLFDVLEHIRDTRPFLEALLFHAKPGGLVFVNVPAFQCLFTDYDRIAGHYRRYDKALLAREFEPVGCTCLDLRYWGCSVFPLPFLRGAVSWFTSSPQTILKVGFQPPHPAINQFFRAVGKLETSIIPTPPFGTSLLGMFRKPA